MKLFPRKFMSYSSLKKKVLLSKEKRRLRVLPRYHPTTTLLFEKQIQIADACTFLVGYQEIFEKKIYEFVTTNDAPIIIDCGANIGLSTLFFKYLYPRSKIIAFEPDPNIFTMLKHNISAFDESDVELYQKAIWINGDGTDFWIEGGYSGRIPKQGNSKPTVRVSTMRLRDLLTQKVDFLKVDIEGAEVDVLCDSQDRLCNVERLFVEYHSSLQEPQRLHEMLRVLHQAGFRYDIQEEFVSSRPFIKRETLLDMDLQLNIFGSRI